MTVQDLLMLLLRRWRLVALSVALGATAGLVYESIQPKVVATEGRLLIGPSLEGDLDVIQSTDSLSRGTLQETLAEIITGNEVIRSARTEVDVHSRAYSVESVVIPETNVAKVTVTGPDGDAATALASAIMSEAERTFEQLYPVYNIAAVNQPDDPVQTAPNLQLGLIIGALIGAGLVAVGLVVSDIRTDAGAEPNVSNSKAGPSTAPDSDVVSEPRGPAPPHIPATWYDTESSTGSTPPADRQSDDGLPHETPTAASPPDSMPTAEAQSGHDRTPPETPNTLTRQSEPEPESAQAEPETADHRCVDDSQVGVEEPDWLREDWASSWQSDGPEQARRGPDDSTQRMG